MNETDVNEYFVPIPEPDVQIIKVDERSVLRISKETAEAIGFRWKTVSIDLKKLKVIGDSIKR